MMAHAGSLVLLIMAIVLLPIFRGGNLDWPPAVFGLLCAFSAILSCISLSSTREARKHVSRPILFSSFLWFLWLSWIALQCLPLPAAWLQSLSPFAYAIHHAVAEAGGQPHYSLSVTPLVSWSLFLWSLAYFTAYLACLLAVRERRDLFVVVIAIVICTSIEATYGALQEVVGFAIEWLKVEGRHREGATGTFANRNHFSAYLTLGAACTLTLILSRRSQIRQTARGKLLNFINTLSSPLILYRVILVALVTGVILSRSRMGNISLALGMSFLAVIWLLQTRKRSSFIKGAMLFLSIALIDVALVSERFGLQRVMQRIESTDLSTEGRQVANSISYDLIDLTWPIGAGFGAYRDIEEMVRPPFQRGRFFYAHNDYLQFAVEVGLIGLCLLAALLSYHVFLAVRYLRSRRLTYRAYASTYLMATVTAMLHATVEFNFYIPAYAATYIILMGLMQAVAANRGRIQ